MRLLRTNLTVDQVKPNLKQLLEELFRNVPCGVGRSGKLKLTHGELREVLEKGAGWAVDKGYGNPRDLEHTESNGCITAADANKISEKAMGRGSPQLGTLGAGNHFMEVQRVAEIYEPEIAKAFGIEKVDQACIMIHTGSRGFG
ncbi:MAG: RtcB family protein, partial [Candidatus Aenigmatarchaeota archaeon]